MKTLSLLNVGVVDSPVHVCLVLAVPVASFSLSSHKFFFWESALCTVLCGSCMTIRATRGAVIRLDASNAWVDSDVELSSPIPPSLTGSARRSCSAAEHASRPVRAGIKCWWVAVSRGRSRS